MRRPRDGLARPNGDQPVSPHREAVWNGLICPAQRDRSCIAGKPIEVWAMETGKSLETIEGILLLEHLRIQG